MEDSPRDPFSAAVLSVLIHRANNATQLVSGVNALLASDGSDAVLRDRAADLAWASTAMRESGWLLALVASAEGGDLLLARREREGLVHVARLVSDALRRERHDIEQPDRVLPFLSPAVAHGWELSWSIGGWLWTAARGVDGALAWSLDRRGERWELRTEAPATPALDRRAQRILALLPDVVFEATREGQAPTMIAPREWLVDRADG